MNENITYFGFAPETGPMPWGFQDWGKEQRVCYGSSLAKPGSVSELFDLTIPVLGSFIEFSSLLSEVDVLIVGSTAAASYAAPASRIYLFNTVFSSPQSEAVQLTHLHWVAHFRQALRETAEFQEDWDSEGARPPSFRTMQTARAVAEKIITAAVRSDVAVEPSVAPLSDGCVRFEWAIGNRELFITISEDQIEVQGWEPLNARESCFYESIRLPAVHPFLRWVIG